MRTTGAEPGSGGGWLEGSAGLLGEMDSAAAEGETPGVVGGNEHHHVWSGNRQRWSLGGSKLAH